MLVQHEEFQWPKVQNLEQIAILPVEEDFLLVAEVVAPSAVAVALGEVMAQVWAVAVCAQAVVNDINPNIIPEHIETNKI